MFFTQANPTLKDCTFTSNSSPGEGDGLRGYDAAPTIENCSFVDNDIYMYGNGTLNPASGTESCEGDVNGDGIVNVHDMLGVIAAWGACP